MLFDYHKWQNAMKPGTVHATYLIYGTKRMEKAQNDGDIEMTSSAPEPELLSDEVATTTLTLAQEDRLEGKQHQSGDPTPTVANSVHKICCPSTTMSVQFTCTAWVLTR